MPSDAVPSDAVPSDAVPRTALLPDLDALADLRVAMFQAMAGVSHVEASGSEASGTAATGSAATGSETSGAGAADPDLRADHDLWESSRRWFAEHLTDPLVRVVVAGPVGAPVSAAVAQVVDRTPSPANPAGRVAVVFNVVTLPAHRGRGYAGACLDEVLVWLDARGDVPVCELVATADGMALYRRRGFSRHTHPLMRRVRAGATGSA